MTLAEARIELQILTENPTEQEVKKAYRAFSKLSHPDVGGDPEVFKRLTEARDVLLNPDKAEDENPLFTFFDKMAGEMKREARNGRRRMKRESDKVRTAMLVGIGLAYLEHSASGRSRNTKRVLDRCVRGYEKRFGKVLIPSVGLDEVSPEEHERLMWEAVEEDRDEQAQG